jgi:succinoglycan biosynthesis protein ExoA
MRKPRSAYKRAVAVVPCLNESAHITGVIESLLGDPGWADPLVVVADGGSTDGTVELVQAIAARDPRVRLLHNARRIQAAGVNLAAALFGDGRAWLVRADAHAEYPLGFVSTLIGEARRADCQSVVVSLRTAGVGVFQSSVAYAQNSWLGTGGAAHRLRGPEGFVDHGHHALFDLRAFRAIGGYDESFTHNEDAEFDVRLRRAGGRIWLTRKAEVTYITRATPGALYRQFRNYGRGRARTVLLHRMRPRVRQLLPLAVAPSVVALLGTPISLDFALPALAWAAGCCGCSLTKAFSGPSAAVALSGPAAMVMHCGWSFGFWSELVREGMRRATALARGAEVRLPRAELAR